MSYTRRIIMAQKGVSNDMTEVYAYARSVGITSQQVDAALADKPTQIRQKLIAWKYLIHSLVDTGYTPWLQGDGVAYIETDITPVPSSSLDIVFRVGASAGFLCGARARGTSTQWYVVYIESRRVRGDWASGAQKNISSTQYPVNSKVTLYEAAGIAVVNGTEYTYANVNKEACDYPFYIYANNDGGSAHSLIFNNRISSVKLSGNRNSVAVTGHFVPYLDNGTYGMLDLVSGNFYGSAAANGLFTYVLEDANGNQVNLQ